MFILEPFLVSNLLFCLVISILGYLGFRRSKNETSLYIAVGFGLFGIAHLLVILAAPMSFKGLIIALRVLAYLTIIISLYRIANKR